MIIYLGIWLVVFAIAAIPITFFVRRSKDRKLAVRFYYDPLYWKIIVALVLLSLFVEITIKIVQHQ